MTGYKVLTHDYRPPLQGGAPVWDGTVGAELARVRLDRSTRECGESGWHYCLRAEDALRIGGLWPDGRPSVLLRVRPVGEWVERGGKCRAESLRIRGVCSERAVGAASGGSPQPSLRTPGG